jgi:hypothetical protein
MRRSVLCNRRCPSGRWLQCGSRALIILLVTGALSCTTVPRERPDVVPGDEWPIDWQVTGLHSSYASPEQVLIRNSVDLARYPLVDVPVDFDTQMVLIVLSGKMRTNSIGVRIAHIVYEGDRLRPVIRRFRTSGADPATVTTAPYCIAVIRRTDLNVEGFSVPGAVRS